MTTSTTNATATRTEHRGRRRAAVLGLTVLTGLLTWAVLDLLLGIDLSAQTGLTVRAVGPAAVAFAALVAGVAGWASLALLERVTIHARRVWTVLAGVVLAGSLLGTLGGVSAAAVGGLMALHLMVGLTVILGLRGRARK